MSLTNGHASYWKLKAAVLAAHLARLQADLQLRAAMVTAGLDPDLTYTMNDAEETFTPLSAPTPLGIMTNTET